MSKESSCNHSWHEFKFGSDRIEYVLDGDVEYVEFNREFRVCGNCLIREYNFLYVDEFKQTQSRWNSIGNISEKGLIDRFRELETKIKRDIKIDNITNE